MAAEAGGTPAIDEAAVVEAAVFSDEAAAMAAETQEPAVGVQYQEGVIGVNGLGQRTKVDHGRICHEVDGSWRLGPSIDKP
jgi:hypothetical protein